MPSGAKRELCSAKLEEVLWDNSVPYELIKNSEIHVHTESSFDRSVGSSSSC